MTRIESSVDINAPVEDVFAYASDYRRWTDWWIGVSPFTPTTTMTRGNGTRYAWKAKVLCVWAGFETEIQDFVETVGWTGVAVKGMAHRTKWVFERKGERTRLTYVLEYKLPLPIVGWLLDSLFIKRQWQHILDRSLANLKTHFGRERS